MNRFEQAVYDCMKPTEALYAQTTNPLHKAILLLLKQTWRTSINRFAEAMTLFDVACAGIFPLFHTGRPWLAYWLFPIPNTMGVWPQFRSPLIWDVFAVTTYFNPMICTTYDPRYDDAKAWVDYESWNPFAARAATKFAVARPFILRRPRSGPRRRAPGIAWPAGGLLRGLCSAPAPQDEGRDGIGRSIRLSSTDFSAASASPAPPSPGSPR